MKMEDREDKKDNKAITVIEVIEQGPLGIKGNFILKDLKRATETTPEEVWLCRCGRSKNKPFCDDSHKEQD